MFLSLIDGDFEEQVHFNRANEPAILINFDMPNITTLAALGIMLFREPCRAVWFDLQGQTCSNSTMSRRPDLFY